MKHRARIAGIASVFIASLTPQHAACAQEAVLDPMRPSYVRESPRSRKSAATAAPRLQAVIGNSRRRLAIIDGRVVEVGQQHRGSVVVRIERDRVLLKSRRHFIALRLPATPSI